MNVLPGVVAAALAPAIAGQSPLTTTFASTHTVGGAAGGVVFFDLTVNTTVTIHRLDVNTQSPIGARGTVQLFQTNPPVTSFSGSETNAANWTLLAVGSVVAQGRDFASPICFREPVTLTPGTAGYAVMHVGVQPVFTQGTGANQTFVNAELTLHAGAAAAIGPYYPDGQVQPFLASPSNPFVWNGRIHYTLGAVASRCSYSDEYGPGCGGRFGSFYELIEDPAVAGAKLPGRSITWIPDVYPTVTRYTVLLAPGTIVDPTAHPPLTGFATTIVGHAALDDGEVVVPVPGIGFGHPGGMTPSLVVHTNGMISVASNMAWLDTHAGDDWAPLVPALLAAPNTTWCSWHDYDLGASGGGQIRCFDDGSRLIITWVGVESYPVGAGNPGTMQFVFHYGTGDVTLTWGTVASSGSGNYAGDPHLVGFSPGGASLRPDYEIDVLATGVIDVVPTAEELAPLRLTVSDRPVIGTTVSYTTSNERGLPFGVLFASVSDIVGLSPFGVDLGFAGAPGCVVNLDTTVLWSTAISSTMPGGTTFILVPDPTFINLEMYLQSAWLDPAANALGVITSNAVAQLCHVN